jgi:outer membrane protein assembly factor BamB
MLCDCRYCLDANTGASVWSYNTGATTTTIDCPPTLNEGALYFTGKTGGIYQLDATTGSLLWSSTAFAAYSTGAVIASGSMLYVGAATGRVLAINRTSTQLVWSYTIGSNIVPSPLVTDGSIFVGANNSFV